jgi:hypothetical protein
MPLTPITLVVKDGAIPFGQPVEGVIIRFYNESGDTFVTEGTTDENGELTLDLEDLTTYWVRFFKVEWKFSTKLRIGVDSGASSNIFDVVGTYLVEHPPSSVPELCRASGYVVGAHGAPVSAAYMIFEATELPDVISGRAMVGSKVQVRSDKWGRIEVELVRGGAYDVTVSGHEDIPLRIVVPDLEACNITDLVFPYVAQFAFDEGISLAMNVGDEMEIHPRVLLSSGLPTPFARDNKERVRFSNYIEIRESVPGVVDIVLVDDKTDTYMLRAKQPGTTTIAGTLKEDVEALRLPEPIRDFQELVITVA